MLKGVRETSLLVGKCFALLDFFGGALTVTWITPGYNPGLTQKSTISLPGVGALTPATISLDMFSLSKNI
jgi:hypothetical protein